MDLMRIAKGPYWRPEELIQGYKSLIWTERYNVDSDFQLVTDRVEETMAKLPLYSFVTLRDSKEVMMVERYEIDEQGENGATQLKVMGRSLTCFMEYRYQEAYYQKRERMENVLYTPAEAAMALLYNAFDNASDDDLCREPYQTSNGTWYSRYKNPADQTPNAMITDSTDGRGLKRQRFIKHDSVRNLVVRFLNRDKLGLRIVRSPETVMKRFTLTNGGPAYLSRGAPNRTNVTAWTSYLCFDVFTGVDRSKNQSIVPAVVLDLSAGHLSQPKYVWDVRNNRNNIRTIGAWSDGLAWTVDDYRTGQLASASGSAGTVRGFDLRWGVREEMKMGDNQTVGEYSDQMDDEAARAFRNEFSEEELYDAIVEASAPFKYGVDYGLGDKLTIRGKYGFEKTMFVSEVIRAEDAEGERSIPGLTLPKDLVA